MGRCVCVCVWGGGGWGGGRQLFRDVTYAIITMSEETPYQLRSNGRALGNILFMTFEHALRVYAQSHRVEENDRD